MLGNFTFDMPCAVVYGLKYSVYISFAIGLITVFFIFFVNKKEFSKLISEFNKIIKGRLFVKIIFWVLFLSIVIPHFYYFENLINGKLYWTFWRLVSDIGILFYLELLNSKFDFSCKWLFKTLFEFSFYYGYAFYISLFSIYLCVFLISQTWILEVLLGIISLIFIINIIKSIFISKELSE